MFSSPSQNNYIFLVKEFLVSLHSIITLCSATIPHVSLSIRMAQKNGSCYFSLACLTPPSACILGWAGVFRSPSDLHGLYKHSQRPCIHPHRDAAGPDQREANNRPSSGSRKQGNIVSGGLATLYFPTSSTSSLFLSDLCPIEA